MSAVRKIKPYAVLGMSQAAHRCFILRAAEKVADALLEVSI